MFEYIGRLELVSRQCYRSVMPAEDTTAKAAAIQLQLLREIGPSGRAQIAVDLSEAVRETTLAGIRRRHPEYSEREVASEFLRLVYGFERLP